MTDICRMMLGSDGHGAFGAFATLPGIDARTADPADLLKWSFRSDWPRIENLHQVGRVTGLVASVPSFRSVVVFPPLDYVPFVSLRYESAAGVMQDDPWCKGDSPGTDPYMTPYRVLSALSSFVISALVGASQLPTAPVPPSSAVYFVWKIPAGTF